MKKISCFVLLLICMTVCIACGASVDAGSSDMPKKSTYLTSPTYLAYDANEVEYHSFIADLIKKWREICSLENKK